MTEAAVLRRKPSHVSPHRAPSSTGIATVTPTSTVTQESANKTMLKEYIPTFVFLGGIVALSATLVLTGTVSTSATESHDGWTHSNLTPCPTEDSDNCYWDANVQGNGTGRSFVTLDNHTYYIGE